MAIAKISAVQAAVFVAARALPDDARKYVKSTVFGHIRDQFDIPSSVKLKVEVDDVASTDFLVLKDKGTGTPIVLGSDGRFTTHVPRRWFRVDMNNALEALNTLADGSQYVWDMGFDALGGEQPDLLDPDLAVHNGSLYIQLAKTATDTTPLLESREYDEDDLAPVDD